MTINLVWQPSPRSTCPGPVLAGAEAQCKLVYQCQHGRSMAARLSSPHLRLTAGELEELAQYDVDNPGRQALVPPPRARGRAPLHPDPRSRAESRELNTCEDDPDRDDAEVGLAA